MNIQLRASDYIEVMGGELEITARFPDINVRINQFHQLDSKATIGGKQ